jgi:putative colanic acid biosynthesis acetyltransferase WcaF
MSDAPASQVDVSYCPSPHSLGQRLTRVLWGVVWALLFRPSPRPCHGWRRMLLRAFGAKLEQGVHVYPKARVYLPRNLYMAEYSCLADDVDCYCVAPVRLGAHTTVSQYSYLCTASHDYEDPRMPLTTAGITIGHSAWVCADAFIGPGVDIGDGAVVGARACVMRSVEPWTIVAGNPAKLVKPRVLRKVDS